jgi:DNA-directed RNA polymerase alpha subunit
VNGGGQPVLLGGQEETDLTSERRAWAISRFDVDQFRMGMDVELEHGTHDVETNVTDDDVAVTAKIARAHLNEFPDYYSRLAVMQAEAEAYWDAVAEQRPPR